MKRHPSLKVNQPQGKLLKKKKKSLQLFKIQTENI